MLGSSRLNRPDLLPLWLLALRLPPPPQLPRVLLLMPLLLLEIPLLLLVLLVMSRVMPLLLVASVASGAVHYRRRARHPSKGLRFQLRLGLRGRAASTESRLQRGPVEPERSAAVRPKAQSDGEEDGGRDGKAEGGREGGG